MINIPRYKLLFLLNDLLLLLIFVILAGTIHTGSLLQIFEFSWLVLYLYIFTLSAPVLIYIFRCANLYKINFILNKREHILSIFSAFVLANLFLLLISLITQLFSSAEIFALFYPLSIYFVLLLFYRVFVLLRIYNFLSHKFLQYNVLLVGYGNTAKLIAGKIFVENTLPIKIAGCLTDKYELGKELMPGVNAIGGLKDLGSILESQKVDEVIFCYENPEYEKLIDQLDYLENLNIRVKVSSELLNIINEKSTVEKYYDIPVFDIHGIEHRKRVLKYKRLFDLFFASVGILTFLPIYIMTYLAVKITSKGPAIYKQTRIGKDGREFSFYKFRSMTLEDKSDKHRKEKMIQFMNEDKSSAGYKVIEEGRLTSVGKFIRKTSIDELPQLFNVLKGDMSLVGPRPCLPYEYQNYTNWQRKRVKVLPGCTGLWQIFGRNKVSFKDSTVMDIYYTYVFSPLRDLEYIIRTLPAMIFARGK